MGSLASAVCHCAPCTPSTKTMSSESSRSPGSRGGQEVTESRQGWYSVCRNVHSEVFTVRAIASPHRRCNDKDPLSSSDLEAEAVMQKRKRRQSVPCKWER